MKHCILLFILLNCFYYTQAQDTLYRTNGKIQVVKIMEVNTQQVKYKNPNGQSGPLFVLSKTEVSKIVYESGNVDQINSEFKSVYESTSNNVWKEKVEDDLLHKNFNRRMIEINLPDYFFGSVTIAYQYFTKNGDYALRVPVSIGLYGIGLNKYATLEEQYGKQGYYRERKKFSTGFDCNYFPTGQGKVRYYVGPSIELGWFDYSEDQYLNYYPYTRTKSTQKANFQSIILQNGFLFQPTPSVNFSLNIGLGYTRERYIRKDISNQYPDDYYAENNHIFAFRAGMCVGYRF
jgi:hypothetical protein